jgi:NAD(P)-dependent dehydrogenase (short-subunit alcohol dehydrogenase family)
MNAVEELRKRYPRRRVVVTGGASGLGLEMSRRFASGGWKVGLFDADRAALAAARAEIEDRGGTAFEACVDVTDEASFRSAFEGYVRDHEGVDVMINNAGVAAGGRMEEIPSADWEWAVGVNLMGVVHGCRLALPILRSAGKGLLLNVASAASFVSSPDMSAYNASKAAVVSLSETLYGELLDTRIQVSVAMPAFFKTNLLQRLRAPAGEMESARLLMEFSGYTVEQAAKDILTGIAKRRLYVFAPSKVKLLWYFKRLSPMQYFKRFPVMRRRRLAQLRRRAGSA